MRVTVDLEPQDFEKIPIPIPDDGSTFFVTTGPDYPFMKKFATEIDKIKAPKLDGYMVKFRFENADGSPWGDLGSDYGPDWAVAKPNGFFKKGPWGTAFIVKRLWIKQQLRVAEAMGLQAGGLFFRHADTLRERYGAPARITAEFEVKMTLISTLSSTLRINGRVVEKS